jgi:hypothetical protein
LLQNNFTEVQLVQFTDYDNDGQFASLGEARLLYSNGINDESLTSNRDLAFRLEGGANAAYWVDSKLDQVFRGRDLNLNGTLDLAEVVVFRDSAVLDGASRAAGVAALADGSVWWSSDGDTLRGILRLFDGNGDGDANDAGEQVAMVSGTHPIDLGTGTVNITTGSFARLVNVGNAVVAFNTQDHSALFRFEDQNQNGNVLDPLESIVFLNATGENPALPMQPDFAAAGPGSNPRSLVITASPPVNGWLSMISSGVEAGVPVVYAGCDSSTTSQFSVNQFGEPINGLVFRCTDNNLDGDANDAGEVTTFYDGSSTTGGPQVLEKIIGLSTFDAWVYVCELNNSAVPVIHRFQDQNGDGDAMDPLEQELFVWSAALFLPNPPFVLGSAPFVTEIGAWSHDAFPVGGNCPPPTTYCTAKLTSGGCFPQIGASGLPSVSNPGGFAVVTSDVEPVQNGLTFFGLTGPLSVPFQGGFLCVNPPLYRLLVSSSGGGSACTGTFTYGLAEYLGHPDAGGLLTPGVAVQTQTWFRDPPSATTTGLSGGLEFTLCP